MKEMVFIMILVSLMNMLSAEIGWSGNIWPDSETFHVDGTNITVYYQIWKDGVTNLSGQGVDISAKLFYKLSTESDYIEVSMPYLGDAGNNDEYSVDIPESYFTNNDIIQFYCEGFDSSDNSYSYGTGQNGVGPFNSDNLGIYYIGSPTSQDVVVTFKVNMSLEATIYDVFVAGTFNNWTSGQNQLTDPAQELTFIGEVLFSAGSNPAQDFKFVNGTIWEEEISNRTFIIDDFSTTQILDVVYFNNHNPVNYLTQDVEVTFNVDVSDSVNSGAVYNSMGINGNLLPLDWDFATMNNPLTEIGNNIWTIDLTFLQGSSKFLEFKFAHDGNDWEAGFEENHQVTIDDSGTTQVVDCVYGELEALSIEKWNIIPNSIIILQNHPNPFNSATKISISLPSNNLKNSQIVIYNMNGKNVMQYSIFGNKSSIIWNAENQSSGVYFYKLLIDNEIIATQKMILLK